MSMVACTEKAGEWPPLLTLMSNNSSVEHLQSDIADWFREHQPDEYDLAEPPSASKLGCESGVLSARDGNTPGELQNGSRQSCHRIRFCTSRRLPLCHGQQWLL